MKRAVILSLFLGILSVSAYPVLSQEQTAAQPSAEEVEKEKTQREKNAYRLLDQVIDEAQSLKLTENRVRIQINAADLLWKSNQSRARSLFSMAADGVAELGRPVTQPANPRGFGNGDFQPVDRGGPNRSFQLRQELVLAVAKHDAALAYQLLAATKPPPSTTQTTADQRGPRPPANQEENLEQTLLGRIAALDPKMAAQNAEAMMDKGQFPRTLSEVINQLNKQDSDAAAKLADKTVKKIQGANVLTNTEAATLAQVLLTPGPKPPASASSPASTDSTANARPQQGRPPVLEQSLYVDLLGTIIDSALKATPQSQTPRAGTNAVRLGPTRAGGSGGPTPPPPPSEAQVEQNNARRLLTSLQVTLPTIDQYLPAKATQLRQKMTELGISTNNTNMVQAMSALQGNPTSDALMLAAAGAPQQVQPRLYQQAAYKALDEGNSDRARQIANDHLQSAQKDVVIQRIEFRELAKKSESTRIDEIRLSLGKLPSDNERLNVLLQLVKDVEKSNPKLMTQLLDDARQMTNRRATNYSHFEQQLRVARAFAAVDPARSFEVLDPGISQLNELLQAASVLSGFETNVFREGEMSIQGGSGLGSTVSHYGQELANLARTDFERSETLAGRFQFPEPRIMARLSIVQGLLAPPSTNQQPNSIVMGIGGGQNGFVRQD